MRSLEGRYGVMLAIALLALVPFIVVSSAFVLYREQVSHDLHIPRVGLAIIGGLSTAGYAFGALLAGDLVQRFRQRRLFLICEGLFVVGCLLCAVAAGAVGYGAGRVLSGFATGLLLVIALPPVIQNFPATKLPITVVAVNMGFFGSVCVGPLLGGAVAAGHVWRWFYAGLAGLGAVGFGLAVPALPLKDPPNPGMRFDAIAVVLALPATVLPFWASGELARHGFASFRFALPLAIGLVCLVALLLTQYHQDEPLAPIEEMWTTFPVVGTLTAMVGGGVFFSFLELLERFHTGIMHNSPLFTGILLASEIPTVLIAAALLGLAIATRFLPALILAGMATLIGGGAMIYSITPENGRAFTLGAAALLGFGAGATVSPGLYLAGFPLSAQKIGRIFALVELVRSVADYILAPVVMRIAEEASGGGAAALRGIHEASRVAVAISIGFTVFGIGLYLLGGGGLPRPDLKGWIEQQRPAIDSPELLARVRTR